MVRNHIRERIIHAGKTVFRRLGFKKTSMIDIAKEVHMGKSSLYYYYPSKEEIFRAVVVMEKETLSLRIHRAVSREKEPKAKLKTLALTRMREFRKLANFYAVLNEDYLDLLSFVERFREKTFDENVEMIKHILDEGVRSKVFKIKETHLVAYAIAIVIKGLEYPWLFKSVKGDIEKGLDVMLGVMINGISK
ncbi:MAG: TetR/AcrR family transcriptional regulator [Planctomycetota bacterium]